MSPGARSLSRNETYFKFGSPMRNNGVSELYGIFQVVRREGLLLSCFLLAASGVMLGQSASSSESVADTFKTNCVMCHGTDGAGSALGARLHVPDLRSAEIQGKSSAVLAQSISVGKNQMPAFGKKFDDQQIQALVAYIRQLRTETSQPQK